MKKIWKLFIFVEGEFDVDFEVTYACVMLIWKFPIQIFWINNNRIKRLKLIYFVNQLFKITFCGFAIHEKNFTIKSLTDCSWHFGLIFFSLQHLYNNKKDERILLVCQYPFNKSSLNRVDKLKPLKFFC